MLRPWRKVETFIGIGIQAIASIVGIDVIGNGMSHVNIDAPSCIHDFDKAVETDPGVVVNGNTEILKDGQAAETNSIVLISVTDKIGFVQFHCPIIGHIDIEVTRDREHTTYLVAGSMVTT